MRQSRLDSRAITDEKPDKGEKEQADKRLRERVDALLGRSPARRVDSLALSDGTSLAYTVTAEFLPVLPGGVEGSHAEPEGAVMTTAYLLDDAPASERPVCFAFNGGPGSASIWLQFGALGPKRIVVDDEGGLPAPPYALVDNPLSWLEHFDLVFVDALHTGWSVSASEEARKKHLSVDGDVEALVSVICSWLTRHRRWASPVVLTGESYGTTRAAAMADVLMDRGVALAGLILVSVAIDLQTIVFAPGNTLPFALYLPGYAAAAQYHGMLEGSAEDARAEAEAFVRDEYLAALHAGGTLGNAERDRLASRIGELIGLPAQVVAEYDLRVRDQDYFVELLRPKGLVLGRLDARSTSPMGARRARAYEFDPAMESTGAPYTMAAHAFFGELGFDEERRYEVLAHDVNEHWNWNRDKAQGNAFANTSADLSRVLRRNEHLRVLVASGYYDLGTPYSATDYTLAQLDVPPAVRERITHRYYDAGHMMYTREADLRQLREDLTAWWGAGR